MLCLEEKSLANEYLRFHKFTGKNFVDLPTIQQINVFNIQYIISGITFVANYEQHEHKSFVIYSNLKVYNLISINSYQTCNKTKQLNVTHKMVQIIE